MAKFEPVLIDAVGCTELEVAVHRNWINVSIEIDAERFLSAALHPAQAQDLISALQSAMLSLRTQDDEGA